MLPRSCSVFRLAARARSGSSAYQFDSLKQVLKSHNFCTGTVNSNAAAGSLFLSKGPSAWGVSAYSTTAAAINPAAQAAILNSEESSDLAAAEVEEFGQASSSTASSASRTGRRNNADGAAIVAKFSEWKESSATLPTLQEYNNVLAELADCRDFPRAWQVFEEMKAASVRGDAETYSFLLRAGQRTLRLNEIRRLFGEVIEHRDGTSAAESSDASAAKPQTPFFEQMQQLVQEMEASGQSLGMAFYEDLANVLATSNQAGALINVSTAMEKKGLQPSTRFYNRLMYCLPRCGLLERAGMLFNRMVLRGTADYYTYLTRASGLVYAGQCEAARQVISSAKAHFPLDTVAFNIIIKSHLERDAVEQAVGVFNQMVKDPAIAPNRVTCRSFLSYFFESGALAEADAIIRYFPQAKFPESTEDYGNLIKFFARYDPSKVMGLMKDIHAGSIPVDIHIYHAFLRILTDRQVTPDWKRTFGTMLLKESQPAAAAAAAGEAETLSALCAELPFHFRELIRQMEQTGVQPNSVTYEIAMRKFIQVKRFDAVTRLYNYMIAQNRDLSLQSVHRNFQLTALLSSGSIEAASEFVKALQSRRVVVSGRNVSLMEKMGMEMPRGLLTAKAGGVSRAMGRKDQQPVEKRAYRAREDQDGYAEGSLNMV